MIVNKAYRYPIYLTDTQKVFFSKTFDCVRFIYNVMLHDKIKHYEESDQMPKNTSAQYMNEQKLAIAHEKVANQRLYYLHKFLLD